jgi:hypothetical protein
LKAGFLATPTRPFSLETFRRLQQFLKNLGAHLVRGRTDAHFHRFQIAPATLPPSSKDHLQNRTQFP